MSEHHKEIRNTMRAYAAFQFAIVLYLVKSPVNDCCWLTEVVIILFAISIPSTIAYAGLARLTPEDEARNPNPISAVSQILAFVPSIIALSLIISTVSVIAGIVFVCVAIVWVYKVVKLRKSQ